ncbi:MAG: DUF433 domain-containing protein [Gammaproteobacteria bacterium]|nr:DUF433 domain-containing protein [Gammaproteobacteria bacterium]
MNWHDHIHSSPAILSGKPVVRGTRLSVDFLLRLLAKGWTEAQLLENYPQVSREALKALFAFAAECTREESVRRFAGPAMS